MEPSGWHCAPPSEPREWKGQRAHALVLLPMILFLGCQVSKLWDLHYAFFPRAFRQLAGIERWHDYWGQLYVMWIDRCLHVCQAIILLIQPTAWVRPWGWPLWTGLSLQGLAWVNSIVSYIRRSLLIIVGSHISLNEKWPAIYLVHHLATSWRDTAAADFKMNYGLFQLCQ